MIDWKDAAGKLCPGKNAFDTKVLGKKDFQVFNVGSLSTAHIEPLKSLRRYTFT